jgi:single-strand DNA-binding protein
MSINKVILIGNVGAIPKRITTKTNNVIVEFTLATSEQWKDKSTGEKKTKTEWHNISIRNPALTKDGSICDYISKGATLYIEGKVETSKYTDKNNQEKYITKIAVDYNGAIQIIKGNQNQAEEPETQEDEYF